MLLNKEVQIFLFIVYAVLPTDVSLSLDEYPLNYLDREDH